LDLFQPRSFFKGITQLFFVRYLFSMEVETLGDASTHSWRVTARCKRWRGR
jgi:hypothetical protein